MRKSQKLRSEHIFCLQDEFHCTDGYYFISKAITLYVLASAQQIHSASFLPPWISYFSLIWILRHWSLHSPSPSSKSYSWNVAPSCSVVLLHPGRALLKYQALKFPLGDQKACIFVCLLTDNLLQTLIYVFRDSSRHKTEELKSKSLLCNRQNVSFSVWSFLSFSVLCKTIL